MAKKRRCSTCAEWEPEQIKSRLADPDDPTNELASIYKLFGECTAEVPDSVTYKSSMAEDQGTKCLCWSER